MKNIDTKNDIVFTPPVTAALMCRLACINSDSVVIDNTAGSGALIMAAADAGAKAAVGIEFEDIPYKMLSDNISERNNASSKRDGVGCAIHIYQGDGMRYYDIMTGGDVRPEDISALLLNPPYSAEDSGFVFADEVMKRMNEGMAVVLTKANSNRDSILEHSTLKAVIKMPDIFKGYASVQAALYVFQCGRPHDIENDKVKFVDFSSDGYRRSGRKTQKGQVFEIPGENPNERYDELVDIVVNGRVDGLKYYHDVLFEDTLKDNDAWAYDAHRVVDTTPTLEDFKKTVEEYLSWKVGAILRGEIDVNDKSK